MGRISPTELSRRVEAFTCALRKGRLKVTPQRLEIFRQLACSSQHPDAEMVYRNVRSRMPTVSRDTVYRTLNLLEASRLAWKVVTVQGRGRFDADMRPHHHFVCDQCGRVEDFQSRSLDGLEAPKEARSLGRVFAMQVQARGVCSACVARRKK